MPVYRVTFEGRIVDVWEVEAGSPEEARELVGPGKGVWVDQGWVDDPVAEVEELLPTG